MHDRDTGALHRQQFGSQSRVDSYAPLEAYAKIFALLDSEASKVSVSSIVPMSFRSCTTIPPAYTMADQLNKMVGEYQRSFVASSSFVADQLYGDSPLSFSSIADAKSTFEFGACLFSGSLDAKLSNDSVVQLPHNPAHNQRNHLANLCSKFWLALQELVRSKEGSFTPKEELAAVVLQLNVLVTWIAFEVELQPAAAWDDFMPRLEEMVLLGEKIVASILSVSGSRETAASFCLESGYIIPMYAVASNCRDLAIRRRAIAVLRAIPRQEGLWNSLLVAKAAERIIEIEKGASREVDACADGLGALSLLSTRPLLEIDAKGGRLHYKTQDAQGVISDAVVEEVFSW